MHIIDVENRSSYPPEVDDSLPKKLPLDFENKVQPVAVPKGVGENPVI